nr:diguanylate cyclase [Bradyrhizobium sp. 150]
MGHQARDGCLQRIAEVIGSATANTGGLSARYGGEEFAVILPGVNEERAVKVADAIRMLVARLQLHHPRSPRKYVTISLGVAEKGDATTDELALTRDTDIACTTQRYRPGTARSQTRRWYPRAWKCRRWCPHCLIWRARDESTGQARDTAS